MIQVISEAPATCFYEQMEILHAQACEDWQEINLNVESYYDEVLVACLSFEDYWERAQRHFFWEVTRDCVSELRRTCPMELS
jgi:hypothetical protein